MLAGATEEEKEEFEDLIGWKPENTFWWNSPQYLQY